MTVLRSLLRARLSSLAVVVMIAVALGGSVAVFAVIVLAAASLPALAAARTSPATVLRDD